MSSKGHTKQSHKIDKTSSSAHSFETYRAVAPPVVDDDELRAIIASLNNDPDRIFIHLQNLWFGIPERLAQASEWVENKTKKPEEVKNKPKASLSQNKSGKIEYKDKRNVKDAKDTNNRSASKPAAAAQKPKPTTTATPAPTTTSWGSSNSNTTQSESNVPASTNSGVPAWCGGMSLAQKLKQQELEKQRRLEEEERLRLAEEAIASVESEPVTEETEQVTTTYTEIETVTTEISYLSHNDVINTIQSTELEITSAVNELNLHSEQYTHEEVVVESTQLADEILASTTVTTTTSLLESTSITQSTTEEVISDSYLKLGRWDTAQQNTPFQFGSFGQDSDNVQSSSWSTSGIDVQSEQSSSVDYSNSLADSTATNDNLASALFSQKSESSKFDQKPPGLGEPVKQASRTTAPVSSSAPRKPDASTSPQLQPSTITPPAYGAVGYNNAPPGINARGPQAPIPPYYGYEQQYVHPYAPMMAAPGIPNVGMTGMTGASTAPSTTTPATSSTATSSTQPANSASSTQQQPQSFAPPPYQYFGNPYYFQPNFYQNPQFYGQGRGMYQAPRGGNVYGTDPYTGTPMYGDMYSQQGQYGELNANTYGNNQNTSTPSAASTGKTSKNTTTSPSGNVAPVPDNYGYGMPYNSRGDMQAAWNYQQNPALWQSMMGYPGGQMQNFGQPQQAPTQRDNSVQRPNAGSSNAAYGQSSFNGRNTGAASGSAAQSNW